MRFFEYFASFYAMYIVFDIEHLFNWPINYFTFIDVYRSQQEKCYCADFSDYSHTFPEIIIIIMITFG